MKKKFYIGVGIILVLVVGVLLFRDGGITGSDIEKNGWGEYMGEIRSVVKKSFEDTPVILKDTFIILDTHDVTGNGIPDVLIDIGTGGASSNTVTLASIVDGEVSVPHVIYEDGSEIPVQFIQGAAVLHAEEVGFDIETNTVYQAGVIYDTNGYLESCTVSAYMWDYVQEVFTYDRDASQVIELGFCRDVANTVWQ